MKHWNKMTKAFRYLAASLVVAIGLATLVGSSMSGGWSIEGELRLTASADSPHHVSLSWTSAPTFGLATYWLYRDDFKSFPPFTYAHSYIDHSVEPLTHYCYRIKAIEQAYDREHLSNEVCITTPGTAGWVIETINDGSNPALALDTSNQPHVSYRNSTGVALAYKSGANWQQSVVDNGAGDTGDTDVAVDPVNADHVSYIDDINDRLMYASNGTGVWQTQTVDTTVAGVNALSVDSAGNAYIVYNNDVTDMGVVSYGTNTTGSWQTVLIAEFSGEAIRDADILVDAADAVHLVFTSEFTTESVGCSVNYMTNQSGTWERQVVAVNTRCGVAMAIDSAGNVHVVYSGLRPNSVNDLIHAYNSSGTWQLESIESLSSIFSSKLGLAIDGADHLHIAYPDRYDNLKYASNASGMWELSFLDSSSTGTYIDPSIAVDPMGNVTVAYTDQFASTIKLVTSP